MSARKLIDTFLFSDTYETEVLLAKLHVEADLVDHWIAVENTYSTKGAPKGAVLESVVRSDPRFLPFVERLSILTLDRPFAREYRPSLREKCTKLFYAIMRSHSLKHHAERPYFYAEQAQRDAATELALELAPDEGAVLVTDVDEMVDSSTPQRRDLLHRALSWQAAVVHLPRRRFVYDFDNVSMARFRHVPLVSMSALRRGERTLGAVRSDHRGFPASPEPLVFEYSYCYERAAIHRKLTTFAHLHPGDNAMQRALECNHAFTTLAAARMRNEWWFERVDPDEARHPVYIQANMDRLKTHAVDPQYRQARHRRYPELFPSS